MTSMNKCILALLLTGCVVSDSYPRRIQQYDCVTYFYCDGYEEYEEYGVCTSQDGAYAVEDDFYYSCDTRGWHNCYNYECAADCAPTGLSCR